MTIDAQDAATTDIDQQIAAELAKESATLETETQVEATQTDDSTQVSEQVDTEGSDRSILKAQNTLKLTATKCKNALTKSTLK